MLHHLCIIGEAVRVIKPEIESRYPDIPWASVIGMRNILIHQYFAVDTDLVWRVIQNDLEPLEIAVKAVLKDLDA